MAIFSVNYELNKNRFEKINPVFMQTSADEGVFMLEAKRDEMINNGWVEWKEPTRNFKNHTMFTILRKGLTLERIQVRF